MGDQQLLFLRDLADVEPPRDRYAHYDEEDIYRLVPRPQWTGLEDEIWTPRSQEHDPQLEKVKALMKRNSSGSNGGDSPGGMAALSATKFASKLARKKRRVQTLTVLLSLFLLMLTVLFTLIFLPQRLGLLSKHDEAHENLLGQGQLFFLLLGAFGAGALLTHMISRLLAARIHATAAAAARAEAESLASGGAVVKPVS